MKAKPLLLAVVALVAAGGFWFAWKAGPTQAPKPPASNVDPDPKTPPSSRNSRTIESGSQSRDVLPKPGQIPRPPDPARRFVDFTPEQRVQFARKGHGPGG